MADGEADNGAIDIVMARQTLWQRIWTFRHTPYILAAVTVAISLTSVVFAHTFLGVPFLDPLGNKLLFLAAAGLLALPLLLLLRDSPDNLAHGPSLLLPAVAIAFSALVVLAAAAIHVFAPDLVRRGSPLYGPVIACLFSGLAVSYIPLVWNASVIWRFKRNERIALQLARGQAQLPEIVDADQRDAEAVSALVSTVIVAAVSALAVAAGQWGDSISLQEFFGVGLGVFVVSIFAVVIFVEPLSKWNAIRVLGRQMQKLAALGRPLAYFYNGIDAILAGIGATTAGMEHRSMWSRYGVLSAQLICLCLLGWFLPAPLGLIPCVMGVVIAISVSRLWAWVEDDRALALLTRFNAATPFRTNMREDYRDETLLAFIFVFVLMPIMMRQAHESGVFGAEMFLVPEGRDGFWNWIGFFGIELAKAVPIVDWAEIYQIQAKDGSQLIEMKSTASRHAVFLARATVDLVLIASLLQAVAISSRNRQQKQLYKAGTAPEHRYRAGLIDRLDKFVEESELKRSIQVCLDRARLPEHVFVLSRMSGPGIVDFRRYNADRLLEIHGQSKDALVRAFIAAIASERPQFTLKSRMQLLEEYAEGDKSEFELYTMLQRLEAEYTHNASASDVTLESLRATLFAVQRRAGLRDFKQGVLDLMARLQNRMEAIEYFSDIAGRSNPDDYQYTRVYAVNKILALAQANPSLGALAKARLHEVEQSKPGASTSAAIRNALEILNRLL